jgi:hypothetical protein
MTATATDVLSAVVDRQRELLPAGAAVVPYEGLEAFEERALEPFEPSVPDGFEPTEGTFYHDLERRTCEACTGETTVTRPRCAGEIRIECRRCGGASCGECTRGWIEERQECHCDDGVEVTATLCQRCGASGRHESTCTACDGGREPCPRCDAGRVVCERCDGGGETFAYTTVRREYEVGHPDREYTPASLPDRPFGEPEVAVREDPPSPLPAPGESVDEVVRTERRVATVERAEVEYRLSGLSRLWRELRAGTDRYRARRTGDEVTFDRAPTRVSHLRALLPGSRGSTGMSASTPCPGSGLRTVLLGLVLAGVSVAATTLFARGPVVTAGAVLGTVVATVPFTTRAPRAVYAGWLLTSRPVTTAETARTVAYSGYPLVLTWLLGAYRRPPLSTRGAA